MRRIDWVFLDMGGVLVDEDAIHEAMIVALHDVLTENGGEMDLETLRGEFMEYFVNGRSATTQAFIQEVLGEGEASGRALTRFRERVYPLFPKLYVLREGAEDVLCTLAGSRRLGVVANQPADTREFVDRSGIERHLEFVLLSGEVGVGKPDRRIFQMALERAGCAAGSCVMVGDRVDMDIAPAKRMGMATVRMRAGMFSPQEAEGEDEVPDAEIWSLRDLPDVVERIERGRV